jgi:hypothetical protein
VIEQPDLRLVEPDQALVALRYVSRTAQRSARRLHVWREEPSPIEPAYAFVSVVLCGQADRQVLPGVVPAVLDPFAAPLRAADVTCDRCWIAYDRLVPATLTTPAVPATTPATIETLGSTA